MTLVEYGDFECPRRSGHRAVADLRERFGDQLRRVPAPAAVRRPPAPSGRRGRGSRAAQGKFWPMYDRLFAHQDRLATTDLLEHAAAVGLDVPLRPRPRCGALHPPHAGRRVRRGQRDGASTFFIGGRRTGPYDAGSLAPRCWRTPARTPWRRRRGGIGAAPFLGLPGSGSAPTGRRYPSSRSARDSGPRR